MNIYHLSQDENYGYDTYNSCVVTAETEKEARLITPNYNGRWNDNWSTWASSPEHVQVQLIGTALPETEPGIILSSFNAG